MRLYDTISQVDLNSVIDKLLNNYHREIGLDLDDSVNDYCNLEFDLSQGVDAGTEVIFNDGDELDISITDKRLAEMGYTLRFYYYLLDKGDYTQSKSYGELQSFDVKLDEDTVSIPFTDNQVYLQKDFELILLKDIGYRLLLNTSSTIFDYTDDVVLTADYALGSVPVEDASVEFYNGETLIDTVDTDEDGLAVLTVSNLPIGSYNFSCVCNGVYSNTVNVSVGSDKVMELNITGSSFSTYSSSPFTYNRRVFVDWGDNSGLVEYAGGKLTHSFTDGLNSHTVKVYGDITSLKRYCFYRCTGLTSITIPDSVTNIGEECFHECYGLTSISIPNSVTSIGEACFVACTGLTSITIPNSITSLGTSCFNSCTGLTSIVIPSSVTSLGNYCFKDCTSLTSITLPNSVTNIGSYCFYGCRSLTSIKIPNSVTNIGEFCFYGCSSLTSIILNWTTNDEIITYKGNWISFTPSNLLFYIPSNTSSLYTAKSYPANRLEEGVVDSVSLTADKSILSYSESATLSATVLDQSSQPMSGKTVHFYEAFEPLIVTSSTKNIIVTGETTDLMVKVRDSEDGSLIVGEKVHFYQIVEE